MVSFWVFPSWDDAGQFDKILFLGMVVLPPVVSFTGWSMPHWGTMGGTLLEQDEWCNDGEAQLFVVINTNSDAYTSHGMLVWRSNSQQHEKR